MKSLKLSRRVMLTRGTIEAVTGPRPLSSLLALTVQLEAVTEVGLLGRHCPRLRSLNLDSNLLATLQGLGHHLKCSFNLTLGLILLTLNVTLNVMHMRQCA